MMSAIAQGTNVSLQQVWQASLLSDEGYAFTLRQQGGSDWIYPTVGISGKSSRGLTYCPQCLASDKDPYYRKSWRYIFNPVCPEHRTLLRQGCSECHKPYSYYKPFDESVRNRPFTTCFSCGSDIQDSKPSEEFPELIARTLEVQTKLNEGLSRDSFEISGYGHVHALSYFNVLHALMYSLTDPELARWASKQYQSELPKDLKIRERDLSYSVNAIEELPTDDIAILLCLGSVLIKDWPNRFLELATKRDLPHLSKLNVTNMPYWVSVTAGDQLISKAYRIAKEEIASAKNILQEKLGRQASQNELQVFMADGKVQSLLKISKDKQRKIEISPSNFKLGAQMPERHQTKKNADDVRKLINLDAAQIKKGYVLTKPKKDKPEIKISQQDLFTD